MTDVTGAEFLWACEIPNVDDQNSAIFDFYQIGPENVVEDVLLDVMDQIFKTAFYDQLRTKEQLGNNFLLL